MNMFAVILLSVIGVALGQSGELGSLENPMILRGEIPVEPRSCIETNGCIPEPMNCPNLTIWHADETCSYLYVCCNFDAIDATLHSPGHVTEAYTTWMGGYPLDNPLTSRPTECTDYSRFPKPSRYYRQTYTSTDFGTKCDTEVAVNGRDRTMSNVLNIVEFLNDVNLPYPTDILLLSHTHVEIQCCHNSKPSPAPCKRTDPEDVCGPTNSTELSFDMKCSVNQDTEFYECSIGLKDKETLGDKRLTYVVESCDASVLGQSILVPLIQGSVASKQLEVELCKENPNPASALDDDLVYKFEAPYFQFDSPLPCPLRRIEDIQIDCKISVVDKSSAQAPVRNC